MDFHWSEEQEALRGLAREILEREATTERVREVETAADGFDRPLWETLAGSSLLGVAVPEAHGGMGYGLPELGVLLHEVGRAVAPLPALPALVWAGLPIARYGTPEQQARWLPGLADGSRILTAALEDAASDDPAMPGTKATREATGYVLEGAKRNVPALPLAERVLVPAQTDGGVGLFLVDPRAEGVRVTRSHIGGGEAVCDLALAGARVDAADLLGEAARPERGAALWDTALVGVCAQHVGVLERAIEITAGYVREREQFGVPIGSFQAVQHRAADGYIDLEAMRWTTWRALDRLHRGEPATREAMVAKFWTAEGGARIAAAAQHLHGGMGSDVDYPIHRYFVHSRRLELLLGGATPQLSRLGRDMAAHGPDEEA